MYAEACPVNKLVCLAMCVRSCPNLPMVKMLLAKISVAQINMSISPHDHVRVFSSLSLPEANMNPLGDRDRVVHQQVYLKKLPYRDSRPCTLCICFQVYY